MDDTKQIGLKKPHKSHRGISTKNVNLQRVRKKLMNVLSRDTDHLMRASFEGKLKEAEASDLRGYLKLIKDLMKQEEDEQGVIPDKELEKIAQSGKG